MRDITVLCCQIARDPLEPVFDQDSITRIKEFCPPDDYSSPDMAANLRLMRPVLSDSRSADVNTLRCITNVNLTLQGLHSLADGRPVTVLHLAVDCCSFR